MLEIDLGGKKSLNKIENRGDGSVVAFAFAHLNPDELAARNDNRIASSGSIRYARLKACESPENFYARSLLITVTIRGASRT